MSTNAAEMSWDDIKALFRETDRKFQETERRNTGIIGDRPRFIGGKLRHR
jgi:hypothetical protein